jgi:3-deoxy-manno-octulosonate cytidylyltransferase (CMP-KDO synthetase)
MIVRTYESSIKWEGWTELYVATDDERIANCCKKNGIPFIMTRKDHSDCLDRCAEVSNILKEKGILADMYIIIQGDEPLFNVKTLDIKYDSENINFYTKITNKYEINDSNCPKVAISKTGRALYISRFAIPYNSEKTRRNKGTETTFYKQIGVYAMSYRILNMYTSMSSTSLENNEGIGLNRFLESDIDIDMKYTKYDSVSVDTEEDRLKVENILNNNL